MKWYALYEEKRGGIVFSIKYYDETLEKEWDTFIAEKSINGTFLQSRRFLNYHEKGKFEDCSLVIYNEKGNIAAVCPACIVRENGSKIFFSHKGSTFGGIVTDQKHYHAQYIMSMVNELTDFLKSEKFEQAYLKITSDIFSIRETDLLQYAFQSAHYKEYKEISLYINFNTYKDDILSNFAQRKRRNVHNCQKEGLQIKILESEPEIQTFYGILCENLKKYHARPVHTLEELLELKNVRLKDECEFFGVFKEEKLIAGTMMFYFQKAGCAHTQYLAALQEYNKLSPMTYLYYAMICEMKKRGYQKLSWGIATEDLGEYLNMGLISSKEDFGSSYSNNLTYFIRL
jgi:lipid II:glycine glycyltransferase (peptidoglycan interpeptide bridge formation enzyme)